MSMAANLFAFVHVCVCVCVCVSDAVPSVNDSAAHPNGLRRKNGRQGGI